MPSPGQTTLIVNKSAHWRAVALSRTSWPMSIGVAIAALTLNLSADLRGGGADRVRAADFQVTRVVLAIVAANSVLRFRSLD
jgi:hypothetical protein